MSAGQPNNVSKRQITSAGYFVLVVFLTTVIAASVWKLSEAKILAAVTGVALLSAIPFHLKRKVFNLELEPNETVLIAGESLRLNMRRVGQKKADLSSLHLRIKVQGETVLRTAEVASSGGDVTSVTVLNESPRGVLRVGPVTCVRRDPLGLLQNVLEMSGQSIVTVLPKTEEVFLPQAGSEQNKESGLSLRPSNSGFSLHSMREYASGDAFSMVDWRATARSRKLLVRQHDEEQYTPRALILTTFAGCYATAEEFELAVSIAASLGTYEIENAGRVLLVCGSSELLFYRTDEFLAHMAAVRTAERPGQNFALKPGSVGESAPAYRITGSGETGELSLENSFLASTAEDSYQTLGFIADVQERFREFAAHDSNVFIISTIHDLRRLHAGQS